MRAGVLTLSSIELSGFKSFAKRTKIEFGQGLVAIVGTNGSGKSNIADAISWVVGEQSAKSLRAGLDVISAANLRFDRLRVYASMKQSTDNRDAANQERSNLAGQLGGEFGSALAWVEPEIQSLGAAKVAAYLKAEPGLKKMVFDGTWLPDGRVLILDQHHRTAAYHGKIGDPVPFVLRPDSDGTYRSSSYLFAMKFYTSWGMIPEREKLEILDTIGTFFFTLIVGNERAFLQYDLHHFL